MFSIKQSMQLNAFDESVCWAKVWGISYISTENNLFIKKAYMRILIDYDPGRMHAKFIHSTKAALIDYRITWSENVIERECARENQWASKRERVTEIKWKWGREKANYPYLAAEQRCARIGRWHAYRDSSYRPPSLCGRARSELLSMVSGKEAGRERGSLSSDTSGRTGTALNAYTKLMPWLQQLSCAAHWEQTPSLCRCCLSSACSHIQSGSIFSCSTHWRCCSAAFVAGEEMFTSHTRHWDLILLQQEIQRSALRSGLHEVRLFTLWCPNVLLCEKQAWIGKNEYI